MAQAKANGRKWSTDDLPAANWSMMAATPVGPYYPAASRRGGGLFD